MQHADATTLTSRKVIGPDRVRPAAENSVSTRTTRHNVGVVAVPPTPSGRWATALGAVVLGGALFGLASTQPTPWPDGATLRHSPLPDHRGAPLRIYLDAGHGAADNPGNRGAYCQLEEGFTLSLAREVADWLEDRGGFETRVSRGPSERVDYHQRVAEAESWGADVFVSLHSDVRGVGEPWVPRPGGPACLRSHEAPGFSVLWSDAGPESSASHDLGRALARELIGIGLPAYDGRHYGDVYAQDPEAAGLFVDRHASGERIFVLWRPTMPAILIETHHALDDREVRRWGMPQTQHAFASALAAALRDSLPQQRQARAEVQRR